MTEVSSLTDAQRIRIENWLSGVNERGEHVIHWEDLHIQVRPDSPYVVSVVYYDGDRIETLLVDRYGHGTDAYGDVYFTHNGSDEECECESCRREAD